MGFGGKVRKKVEMWNMLMPQDYYDVYIGLKGGQQNIVYLFHVLMLPRIYFVSWCCFPFSKE